LQLHQQGIAVQHLDHQAGRGLGTEQQPATEKLL